MAKLEIKLFRSLAGCTKNQIATANSLGLRKTGSTSIQPDNEATRGKIHAIAHLVESTESKEDSKSR